MNRLFQKAAPFLVLAGGIFLIVLGFIQLSQMKNYIEVPAVVSRVEVTESYDEDGPTQDTTIYVKYTVDGQAYEEVLSFTKTNLNEGDQITVRYNPQNPHEVSGASKSGATLYFVFGGVVTLAGIAIVLGGLRRRMA